MNMVWGATKDDVANCLAIIKDVTGSNDSNFCNEFAEKVMNTVYSIGGSYSPHILREVASTLWETSQENKRPE
jgi:hypothetical protein